METARTSNSARVSATLMTEIAQRAGVLYKASYLGATPAARGCLAVITNMRGLQQFGDAILQLGAQAQQQGDLAKYMEIRELIPCLSSLRCDNRASETTYYWPNITVC